MFCQEDDLASFAAEAPSITENDDERVLEKLPSCLDEISAIMLRVAAQGDERIESQVLDLLTDARLKMNTVNRTLIDLQTSKMWLIETLEM